MKDIFQQYYSPSEDEWESIWEKCIFILDTNVLLNLFRYSKATSDDLLQALKSIANRLWIPHQVALEYHENLQYVTVGQLNKYTEVDNVLNSVKASLQNQLSELNLDERHYSIDPSKLVERVDDVIGLFQKELLQLKKQQPKYHEQLTQELEVLLKDKVGKPPADQKALDTVYSEADKRFSIKRPPGYMDRKKEKDQSKKEIFFYNNLCYYRKYGDLIVWFQIIEEVKQKGKKHVIFVTDDNKEDWWREIGGRRQGPRYELIDEMRSSANVDFFHMYNSARFLAYAKQKFQLDIKEASIEQVRVITSKQVDFTTLRHRTELAERAVLNWLLKKYPTDRFERVERGIYDILQFSESGTFAYAVKMIRADYHATRILQDYAFRGHYEVMEGRYKRLILVFVFDKELSDRVDWNRIQVHVSNFLNREENRSLSASISVMVGMLLDDSDDAEHLSETQFVRVDQPTLFDNFQ